MDINTTCNYDYFVIRFAWIVGGRKVAVKILKISSEQLDDIHEEYRILRDLSSHPNLPEFYEVYLKRSRSEDQVWFVMEVR